MQVSHPFDNPKGQFYILQNSQRQFSLWPAQYCLPLGWEMVSEPQAVEVCNAWLTAHWSTLTPAHYAY